MISRLDPQRERIQADLRGLLAGEVRCDDIALQLYCTDGSLYEVRPLAVVRPRNAADVAACVQYAAETGLPLSARGAGSGQAGESLCAGLVLDFSAHMRRIMHIGEETVRVQPGVVVERLNAHLRRSGRGFGPDAGSSLVNTVGGAVAVDGAGRHYLGYGAVRDHLIGLEVVLADGTAISAGREPLCDGRSRDPDPRKRQLVDHLADLLRKNQELIDHHSPRVAVDRSGYRLDGVLTKDSFDLARMLAGSEGTLALWTEVELATQPLPGAVGAVLLMFDSLDRAARAVPEVLGHRPSSCDLFDRRHLSLARESEVRFDTLIPKHVEAVLLVEAAGAQPREVRRRLLELVDEVVHRKRLALDARQAFEVGELELFRQLAVKIPPALYRMKGARPLPSVEDAAVRPENLAELIARTQNVLKRHQLTAAMSAYAGQGQLHVYPFLDLADPRDAERLGSLTDDLCEVVLGLGGTISGERGVGLARTPLVGRQHGPLYEVFREIKRIFDPQGILNPGKVVGTDPRLHLRNLRPTVAAPRREAGEETGGERGALRDLVELQLDWEPSQVVEAARQCHGCGECRTQGSGLRMCPIFRILPAEEASPRAKANLIRGVLTGRLELSNLTSEAFKGVADLCVNCHMCVVECRAEVDIPKLMAEGKGAYVAANGLRFSDWLMTRVDLVSATASFAAPLANWALGNRQVRWLMEKLLGVAQGRKLPRSTSRPFLRRAARRRLTQPRRKSDRKVAFFVDTYANYHDPLLAECLVAILKHNGVAVYVPPRQTQSGASAVSLGALDHAQYLARRNVAVLADAVRQGYHVVTAEPAAASCITREYPNLVDDDDTRLVADHTSEACTYLWRMHTAGELQLDFKPIAATVGYHVPCRLRALGVGAPSENLLRLIPGLKVLRIEAGCSGMAGTFGLKQENYRASLRAGWQLISRLRDPAIQAGTTECSTCKMQMEQGTSKPTIHPLKLFALAYRLPPADEAILSRVSGDLIVT